jgi:HSP20 family molecular chaperone IbpA
MFTCEMPTWKLFDKIFEDFSNIWEDFDGAFKECKTNYPNFPPTDIYIKKDKTLIFEIAVAGYPEDNVKLDNHGDKLIVELEPLPETDVNNEKRYIKRGLKHSKCSAEYYVPSDKYKTDEINAKIKGGILTVEIPAKESVEPKKIEIKKE